MADPIRTFVSGQVSLDVDGCSDTAIGDLSGLIPLVNLFGGCLPESQIVLLQSLNATGVIFHSPSLAPDLMATYHSHTINPSLFKIPAVVISLSLVRSPMK
jgi:hypothetical protein